MKRPTVLRILGSVLLAASALGAALLGWRATRRGREHAAYESAPPCDERNAVLADSSACRLTVRADINAVDCLRADSNAGVCDVDVRIATLEDELRRSVPVRREYASLLRAGGHGNVELFHGAVVRIEIAGTMVPREQALQGTSAWMFVAWIACASGALLGAWMLRRAAR